MADNANTGTENQVYNVISILYHALQGAETYEKYIRDAAGDEELASFFREVKEEDKRRADRAKALLRTRLGR